MDVWPEPVENYQAIFDGKLVPAQKPAFKLFPVSMTSLQQGVKVQGCIPITLSSIPNESIAPLKDYNQKARIIAEAMKHEYDVHGLMNESVTIEQILKNVTVLNSCFYTSYLIKMILQIHGLRFKTQSNKPFICIVAPSCTGKTQLAFALDNFSQHPFAKSLGNTTESDSTESNTDEIPFFHSVIHIICGRTNVQDIYGSFLYSEKFMNLLYEDFMNIKDKITKEANESRKPPEWEESQMRMLISGSSLVDNEDRRMYRSLGFLRYLIQQRENGDSWAKRENGEAKETKDHIAEASLSEFREFIKERRPVVVCLDEFSASDHVSLNQLYFCRNLLREACCVVATMGTNSKATNLSNIDGLGDWSGTQQTSTWVYLVSELPRLPYGILCECYPKAVELLNAKKGLRNWLLRTSNDKRIKTEFKPLLISHIPGFVDHFFEELNKLSANDINSSEINILNIALKGLLKWLPERKNTLKGAEAFLGQLLLHFAVISYDGKKYDKKSNLPSCLINSYFTFLHVANDHLSEPLSLFRFKEDLYETVLKVHQLLDNGDNLIYNPKSYLSKFCDEELVYLTLLKLAFTARNNTSTVSFQTEKDQLLLFPSNHSVRMLMEQKYAPGLERCLTSVSRNGAFLENLGLASIVRASVLGPFSGQSFADFFLALCKQLSLVPINDVTFDFCSLGITADFIVPFLAPVNAYFSSSFRSIEGVYAGTVIPTINETQIDGFVLPFNMMTEEMEKLARHDISKEDSTKYQVIAEQSPISSSEKAPIVFKRNISSSASQLKSLDDGKKGLVITVEMKNYAENVEWAKIKYVCEKAINFPAKYLDENLGPKKHVHLIFLSKKADWLYLQPESFVKTWKAEKMAELKQSLKTVANIDESDEAKASHLPKRVKTSSNEEGSNPTPAITTNKSESGTKKKKKPLVGFSGCRFFVTSFEIIDSNRSRVFLEKYVLFSEEEETKKLEQELALDTKQEKNDEVGEEDKEEATEDLLDVIILPIENMFVHNLP